MDYGRGWGGGRGDPGGRKSGWGGGGAVVGSLRISVDHMVHILSCRNYNYNLKRLKSINKMLKFRKHKD